MVSHDPQNGPLFPWQPRYRWKQRALRRYRAWQRAYQRVKWAARGARLALRGAVTLAQVVDWLTLRQQPYQIGALPVLYALLETIQVSHIINRDCPTRGEVAHGTVAVVLILNRLMFPLPLYQVDFGFAHNTPMNKRKFKLGLNVAADGNIPWLYNLLSGPTADQATVAENMNNLATWLQQRGHPLAETLIVADRAMLNDEIAIAYDRHGLRHLTGLRCTRKEDKALLTPWPTEQFYAFPLEAGSNLPYGGRGGMVTFTMKGRQSPTKDWSSSSARCGTNCGKVGRRNGLPWIRN